MLQRRAFSLIEVLLVMAIIAVVTAMGFSISKTGMERAYNQYWYTGYEALLNVTTDAVINGKFDPTIAPNDGLASNNLQGYVNHLVKMVNAQPSVNCTLPNIAGVSIGGCRRVNAPNGISYEIANIKTEPIYIIDMTIPALNQRRGYINKTRFIYIYNSVNGFPIADGMIYPSAFSNNNYISLMDRVDILPFYLASSEPNALSNRTFYSFIDAFCHAYYHNPNATENPENPYVGYNWGNWNSNFSIQCPSNFQVTSELFSLPIIPINPRKAF